MASTSCTSQIVTSRRSIVGNAKASLRPTTCAPRQFAGMRAVASANRLGCSIGAFTANRVTLNAQTGRRSSTVAVTAAAKGYKVALLGSAGGIGQPLGLLLKMNKYISELSLYDIAPVNKGVAADLSHCNTPVKAEGYVGDGELGAALAGAQLVVIPAGVPRKPGMTRDDLFNINAGIVKNLVEGVAKHAPNAVIAIISNPVNSTVPIAAEVLKAAGVYDPKKVLGVTTLDVVRANTFVAEAKNLDLKGVDVPVIGGHAGTTILPLLSQVTPSTSFTDAEVEALTKHIQEAGTEVVEAKQGAGSATLSMAYAAARFAESVLLGFEGNSDIYEAAYVATDLIPGLTHFATKVRLGKEGVEQIPPLPQLSAYEQKALEEAKSILAGNIKKGVEFASAVPAST